MEDIIIFFPIFVFTAVGISFYFIMKKRDIKDELEEGKTPIYTENGGARFDKTNSTFPFVRIAIYDDFLVLSSLKQFVIHYHEIERIELYKHMISTGVQVHHNRTDLPKRIIIWSKNSSKVMLILDKKVQKVQA